MISTYSLDARGIETGFFQDMQREHQPRTGFRRDRGIGAMEVHCVDGRRRVLLVSIPQPLTLSKGDGRTMLQLVVYVIFRRLNDLLYNWNSTCISSAIAVHTCDAWAAI